MKKVWGKIAIAFVFAVLGFLITYQLKISYKQTKNIDVTNENAEIVKENEVLEKQKKEYQNKLNELQNKVNEYEKTTVGKNKYSKMMLEQLDSLKQQNGLVDLQGIGLVMYITPKNSIFTSDNMEKPISDEALLKLVNEFYAAEAEAISINDIRITSRTGIRVASNAIRINNEKIPFDKQVVIKVIGNQKVLESALSFPGNIPDTLSRNCDIKWELKNDVVIKKDTTQELEFKYARPTKKE